MLARLGVRYVIAGHSERRQMIGEDDEVVNRKVRAVLRNHMVPILCVGETSGEHATGLARERVSIQVRAGLAEPAPAAAGGMVIAYEPLWAIGTGQGATPENPRRWPPPSEASPARSPERRLRL